MSFADNGWDRWGRTINKFQGPKPCALPFGDIPSNNQVATYLIKSLLHSVASDENTSIFKSRGLAQTKGFEPLDH